MKILQVIPAFYPARGYGGGPLVAYEISKKIVVKGHEVVVYTTDADNETTRFKEKTRYFDRIKVNYFKNINYFIAFHHKVFISPSMIWMAKKELKNYDVIHMHDTRTFQNVIIHYFAKKYKIPYVLQPHGTLSSQVNTKKSFKVLFDILFGNQVFKDASKIIALNDSEGLKCKEMGLVDEQIAIIPNGINLRDYNNLPEKGQFKRKLNLDDNVQIVLYLGRIHESKGIELLINSFSKLSKKLNNTLLVIVGPDDGYLSLLMDLVNSLNITDKVLFTGPVSEIDKFAAYTDSDVFVTPSFYGFPLTFLEAMACGTPIVTTNKGDFIENIDHKVGYVVEYNEDELANAIYDILTDDLLRDEFKKNCTAFIKQFDWSKIAKDIEEVYCKVSGVVR